MRRRSSRGSGCQLVSPGVRFSQSRKSSGARDCIASAPTSSAIFSAISAKPWSRCHRSDPTMRTRDMFPPVVERYPIKSLAHPFHNENHQSDSSDWWFSGRGAWLFSKRVGQVVVCCFEKFFRKQCGFSRAKVFARKNINVGSVTYFFVKVSGD